VSELNLRKGCGFVTSCGRSASFQTFSIFAGSDNQKRTGVNTASCSRRASAKPKINFWWFGGACKEKTCYQEKRKIACKGDRANN